MELKNFLPLDKSWIIRMGILDLINDKSDIRTFLDKQEDLGEDLLALKRIVYNWENDERLDVGESGTLYRLLRFVLWKKGIDRPIIKRGTLLGRQICNNPEIINWPISKLLTLDNNTSQWASAAVLMGNQDKIEKIPHHLNVTYEAVKHWNQQRQRNQCWFPIFDNTIKKQAEAFTMFLRTGYLEFTPKQPEDYCFARAFGLITKGEGEKRWPSLRGHESDRIKEMEIALEQAKNKLPIEVNDHRVIQAVVMLQLANSKDFEIVNKDCVKKSWPKFWEMVQECKRKN